MSLEASIAENTAAIRELIAKLSTGAIISQDATETKKPPRGAAKTAETAPATTTAAAESSQSSGATPTAPANSLNSSDESIVEQNAATYEQAKDAVLALSKGKGREAAVDALSRFGAKKLPELAPEHFGDLIMLVNEMLASAEA